MKSMNQFKGKEKKVLKKMIDGIIENRKKQLDLFERNITEQIRTVIKIAEETKKGKYPIEYMIKVNETCSNYLRDFLEKREGVSTRLKVNR